jgi:outer membrane biosynthesis protein TonB
MTLKKTEAAPASKDQGKPAPAVDPKATVAPAPATKTEPKVEAPAVQETKTAEPQKDQANDKNAPEREKFKSMTEDQRWAHFGGRDKRGVVSEAIRFFAAIGFTRGQIADLLNKRYQHVRNVLVEDARAKKD